MNTECFNSFFHTFSICLKNIFNKYLLVVWKSQSAQYLYYTERNLNSEQNYY